MRRLLLLSLFTLVCISCQTGTMHDLSSTYATQAVDELQKGNSGLAVELFAKALELEPQSIAHRYNLGLALYTNEQYGQALTVLNESLALYPHQSRFFLLKAKVLSEVGEQVEALQVYRKLFDIDPGSYELQALVMQQALKWGYTEEAQALALRLLDIHQQEEKALEVLAQIHGPESWYAKILLFLKPETSATSP
ncbi:MAG: tetratricopeptide repeat protein [Spirochaetia bacterium]|nr:tetratricopeptide repeat protein [Spirochaetia bacterium]